MWWPQGSQHHSPKSIGSVRVDNQTGQSMPECYLLEIVGEDIMTLCSPTQER